jgi:predicted ATP-grasp superfamily ATP-dependent carboligase
VGIVPITDAALAALQAERREWSTAVRIIGPSVEAANAVLNKEVGVGIANSLSIPCPLTINIDTEADIAPAMRRYPLPWVLKRTDKAIALPDALKDFSVLFVDTESQLREQLMRLWSADVRPQIQQFFYGNLHVLCCFRANGTFVAHEYVSVRRSKHSGVLRTITEANPQCRVYAERLLQAMQWEGVACVQFLVNGVTGEICYLETNGRFWASTQGSINAGWDFPTWAVRYSLDGVEPSPPPLQIDSSTCYHTDDLKVLLRFLGGGPSPSLDHTPSQFRAVLNYLMAFGPGTHSDVFSWSDPLPSIVDHFYLFRHIVGEVIKWRAGKNGRRSTADLTSGGEQASRRK